MGLHLPEAPPPDSDEEEDPEGAAALRSRASIPMDAGQTLTGSCSSCVISTRLRLLEIK